MKFKRAFLFGCSYTEYKWPTWANILQKDLDIPVYNWGLSGIGNVGIHCRMLQCDIKHKFTSEDLIIVVWSSWTREDRYIQGRWKNYGNLFNQDFYDDTFRRKYWDWENDVIKNSTSIISATKMFPIFYQASIVPITKPQDLYMPSEIYTETIDKLNRENGLIDFFHEQFPKIDDFNEIKNSRYDGIIFDHHPDIKCHQKFVTDYIYPKLNLTMKDSTDQDIDSYWNQAKARFKDLPSKHDWPIVTGCADSLWGYGNWERNTYYDL